MRSKKNVRKSKRYKGKKVKYTKKRKSRNKKKRGGLTGWELLLGGAALAGGAMKLKRMRKTRKNIERVRELQESLMRQELSKGQETLENYKALAHKVNDHTQPGTYEIISSEDIDSITFERDFKINENCFIRANGGHPPQVLIDCIEYMINKILPLFEDEIDTIAWKKDRITSGNTGDVIAISTRGGKFILFKTIEEGEEEKEIYGTIRGSKVEISSQVFMIARVKNSGEGLGKAPNIYAFVFKNLTDAIMLTDDVKFAEACEDLLQRSSEYGYHRDAYCTNYPGREGPAWRQNIMIDDETNKAYYCDMGSFVWN